MPFFRFTTVLAAALAGGLFLAAAQVRAQAPAPLAAPVPAPAPAKPYRIGAAVYGLKGEFMQMWTKELKAHPAVKDGTVQITVFDGNYDALTQSNQFDTMITQKYDGILFVPIDLKAGAAPVHKAVKAGIPVVGSNTRVQGDVLTSYVGNDDVVAGRMQAEALMKAIGGKGNIVVIEGLPSPPDSDSASAAQRFFMHVQAWCWACNCSWPPRNRCPSTCRPSRWPRR